MRPRATIVSELDLAACIPPEDMPDLEKAASAETVAICRDGWGEPAARRFGSGRVGDVGSEIGVGICFE